MYVTEIEKTNKKIVSSKTINKHKQPHRPLTITQHAERRILQYGFYYQERFLRNFCLSFDQEGIPLEMPLDD